MSGPPHRVGPAHPYRNVSLQSLPGSRYGGGVVAGGRGAGGAQVVPHPPGPGSLVGARVV